MSFSLKYGRTDFTSKIAEMGDAICRKLSLNKHFLRTKNVVETMDETALCVVDYLLKNIIEEFVKQKNFDPKIIYMLHPMNRVV